MAAVLFILNSPTTTESQEKANSEKTEKTEKATPKTGVPTEDQGSEREKPAETAKNWRPAPDRLKPDITKLLPDFKILKGSPQTIVDLHEVFREKMGSTAVSDLLFEVKYNKKEKVAKAQVVGSQLVIQWGKIGKTEIKVRVTNKKSKHFVDNKFIAEVWEPDYWKLILTVVGGLGIFLLGMKNMSEGLQAIAGHGLRRMISAVTDNRFLAVGVGTAVTMLIQSSSITTVMVVGFVNSGFMALSQAIGVIMGANIGTTITGWILVLKIGKYGLPMLGTAAFLYLFSKREQLRFIALAIMGLGMVFFGLELMKNGFAIVKDLPAFEAWFTKFSADSYIGVLKCAMVGCVVTFIVQSSSATLGITIGLAVTEVIPFSTAAALVLGENIGTTITAFLASLGTTVNAKRAAYFHMMFNTMGVLWITAIFIPVYVHLIRWLVGTVPDPETGIPVVGDVTEAIALTHTLFNVANTLLFIPLVHVFARMLLRFVPEKAHKEKPHLTSLDIRMLETSAIAIEQSRVEVMRMANGCEKIADLYKEVSSSDVPDQKAVQQAFHREEVLDTIQDEIVAFMTHLLSGNVPLDITDEGRRQIRIADEYESVGDYYIHIFKSHLKLESAGLRLAESDREHIAALHDMVTSYLQLINRGYERRDPDTLIKARPQGDAITSRVKELRRQFLESMSNQKLDPQVVVAYSAQLNAYRRIREHLLNIEESIAGEK